MACPFSVLEGGSERTLQVGLYLAAVGQDLDGGHKQQKHEHDNSIGMRCHAISGQGDGTWIYQ